MNLSNLTLKDVKELNNFRCKHGHSALAHPKCWREETNHPERIGFLDTEFYAGKNNWGKIAGDWGVILCWVIGDEKGRIKWDLITKEDLYKKQDKNIVRSCIKEMWKYDRIIHHYGDNCDLPLLRTRALYHKLPFPLYGDIKTTDVWKLAKGKLLISSNSQANISRLLRGKSEKTLVDPEMWMAALRGDKRALNYILKHCKIDVQELRKNYRELVKYSPRSNRSI